MTLYNLLRRLVQLSPMSEPEKNDALALIDRLQEINAFSTVAQQVHAKGHECYYDHVNHNCIYCGTKAEGWQ
jgi:hypothetical protein